MKDHEFWHTISDARQRYRRHSSRWDVVRRQLPGSAVETVAVLNYLGERLDGRRTTEIAGFHRALTRVHRRAFRYDVWTAFGLLLGDVDCHEFTDAISWLILRGKRTFAHTLVDPDRLAGHQLCRKDNRLAGALNFLPAATLVPDTVGEDTEFQAAMAADSLLPPVSYPEPPPGPPPRQDACELYRRFPRLTANGPPAPRPVVVTAVV
ncbi:DUF4240 domain-containing protein [Amycolatopsis suaedae]|uniref:DUF4240 domain-containing protein n=1 Tax=Amycolatopsis suaedae TaxID=2510978 RepID=A0A4Q7J956_9PSEU|nr:DUF4240 domain-containing protein [Amycolatopsis suaedae]RZQ62923.1 DUF4240 domain-containing protein [Amycolatopsis suaedae]